MDTSYQFNLAVLTQSLALITHLSDHGFTNPASVADHLCRTRDTILALMKYCIEVDRDVYAEYVQALSQKSESIIRKLVTVALSHCIATVSNLQCQSIIQAVYELLLLLFSFANPTKFKGLLVDDYGLPGPNGIHISTLHTNHLLSTLRMLQKTITAEIEKLGISPSMRKLVNGTPANLFQLQLKNAEQLVAQLTLAVINNTVPTSVLFLYFLDILQRDSFCFLDLEYFEEFLTHFARVNKAALAHNTPLFDFEKKLIKDHLMHVISLYPFHSLPWATAAQTINHLQVFVDVYNEVYEEELVVERKYDVETGEESTVVRRCDAKNCHEQYQYHVNPPPLLVVPKFVDFFDAVESYVEKQKKQASGSGSASTASGTKDNGSNLESRKLGSNLESSKLNSDSSFAPRDALSLKIFEMNEAVAKEVRHVRAQAEARIAARIQFKPSCFKCKYVPWHKHY